jgi:hypothetical protein
MPSGWQRRPPGEAVNKPAVHLLTNVGSSAVGVRTGFEQATVVKPSALVEAYPGTAQTTD